MCVVCGCDGDMPDTGMKNQAQGGAAAGAGHHHHSHDQGHDHLHSHDHHNDHDHSHDHGHAHHPHSVEDEGQTLHYGQGRAGVHVAGQSQERLVQVERAILGKNNDFASLNRKLLSDQGVTAINMLSSPGSGKTTLLTASLTALAGQYPMAVIEGDQQTSNDAARIRETGVEAIQINTGKGCHLDADMVGHALSHISLPAGGFLFIENVGNLVCPASFDLGETLRVVLASTTEGEDKPVKYPDMFATADIVLMTKADLLPYLNFDVAAFEASVRAVNADAPILSVSSTAENGLGPWLDWLKTIHSRAAVAAE